MALPLPLFASDLCQLPLRYPTLPSSLQNYPATSLEIAECLEPRSAASLGSSTVFLSNKLIEFSVKSLRTGKLHGPFKHTLASNVDGFRAAVEAAVGLKPGEARLVYKGKAMMDGKALGAYIPEDSMTVTVYLSERELPTAAPVPASSASKGKAKLERLEEGFWIELEQYLVAKFSQDKAALILEAFKSGYNLALDSASEEELKSIAASK